MTHEEIELHAQRLRKLLYKIDDLVREMNNHRNDGWIQAHYRNSLTQIRDYINKALD